MDERRHGIFSVNRRIIGAVALSAVLAVSASNDSGSEGHNAYVYNPVPQEDFIPLEIQGELKDTPDEENHDNSPGNKVTVVFPSPSPSPSESSSPLQSNSISTPKPEVQRLIPKPTSKPTSKPKTHKTSSSGFIFDSNVSWYGPNFYGHRTACGQTLTKTLMGVANKTLPCGTLVDFKYKGSDGVTREKVVPVVDRGPYVNGRQWDLTGGLAVFLHHNFTGSIYYKVLGK